jgi:hypothetical protein
MERHLIVTEPFGGYPTGALITDPDTVAEILAGQHAGSVTLRVKHAPAAPGEADHIVGGA